MIVEPMTDAELDGLRSKIFAYNRKERSRLRLFGQNVIRILARLDAERTRADRAGDRVVELIGERVGLMLQLDDTKRALTKAEAERDVAVARAMPEPRLMRTVEEVEALPEGSYLIRLPSSIRAMLWVKLSPRIFGQGAWMAPSRALCGNAALVETVVSGPLPDLPTPTAAQEAANG